MTRALLVLVPAATALAAYVSTRLPAPGAIVLGVTIGSGTAGLLWAVQSRRVRHLAKAVNDWLGADQHHPVATPGGSAWQQLGVAVNAIGSAYGRRGKRLVRARRQRLELMEAIDEPALLFGADRRLVRANQAAQELFDIRASGQYTAAQALAHSQLAAAVDEARDSDRSVAVDATVGEREVSALAAPVGEETFLLVTDRTQRRLVNAVRRDFVANASHELKTPVAGIQALTEGLTVTIERDPERAVALARRLDAEARHLGKLVRDLLDLRRLEEGGDRDREAVDLVEVIREEVASVQTAAARRDVDVSVDMPDRAVIVGRREDLRLVVANLLDNAVGYNRSGGSVTVSLAAADGRWELVVEDTGIGIARQDLDRVFERFYRVDVARSRSSGGTGLGLSIVRHAVERHGGRIDVDSILGEGTTVTVELPVEPPR